MATKAANKRLMKEYAAIQDSPPPFVLTKPLENNVLEWHYVITGPPDSPFEGGEYHGKIVFPGDYPFKPPSIQMITPNGRFKTNTRLCLSMSDFHPESWNPSWSVSTILTGLLSFMLESTSTTGSLVSDDLEKKNFAKASRRWNRETNPKFKDVFPELASQPVEIAAVSSLTSETSPKVASKPAPKQQNAVQDDMIMNEVSYFLNSGALKVIVLGMAVAALVSYFRQE